MNRREINLISLPYVKKAFTLVELIVVITILAILGTIAFISLQGYSSQSRDSVRISDISRMKIGLELFQLDVGKYPIPTDGIEITYSGGVVWTQGYFGKTTYSNVGKLDKIPLDPLTDKKYVYSSTNIRQEFQLAGVMEGDNVTQNRLSLSTHALEKTAFLKISGNYNGKLLKVSTGGLDCILALPSIITSGENTDIETIVTNEDFGYNGYKNLPIQYKGGRYKIDGDVGKIFVNNSDYEVFCGNIADLSSAEVIGVNARNELLVNLQNAYTGTTIMSIGEIARILSTDNNVSSETELLMSNMINNNLGGNIILDISSINISINSCDETTKPLDDFNKIYTVNATTDNQAYLQGSIECGYSCTGGYTGINCDNPPLITSTDCTNANWLWASGSLDNQGNGFCISPRMGDFGGDSTGNGISWNGWGNLAHGNYYGWTPGLIDDSGNTSPTSGQTRTLDSSGGGYTCKPLGTATDVVTSDTIVGRMKWLDANSGDLTKFKVIDWIENGTPPYDHSIPALFIADCIDGVKNLGTDMDYKHYPNENLNETITYNQYNNDVTLSTSTAYLTGSTYQNRQKYLTAWTQESGSHLPSAFSYIVSGGTGGCPSGACNDLIGSARGEYQVACDENLLIDGDDDADYEWIWLSSIGNASGQNWGDRGRIIGVSDCGNQDAFGTGNRHGSLSARFVVRP